ncbi:hypothetical protein CYLTODRAFT_429499 [Cylindrobasidium torrendii FP15055 ss-10]|uniref:Arginyl-tRNA--protein transferase 1 n=1 Tax=Cylindrobasidium torrendii FP15055 ss-10 TaxID=1314674 RepID=A0A0D7BLN1_9AGAR|nr:hypothetical protein CYLTODRAFT_429499 [Cylindrobasidium torrendii FP15055 ss-10]
MISIVAPGGYSSSSCGYCSPAGERSTEDTFRIYASCTALQLSCAVYQQMIDRNWRRSGTWCYRPDLKRSCCPLYTIKLDVSEFKPSKSQRKLVNRWNRFVMNGADEDVAMDPRCVVDLHQRIVERPTLYHSQPARAKGKKAAEFIWPAAIHASEQAFAEEPVHDFQVELEPSSYTQEKFDLYRRYQEDIHNDHKDNPSGFKRFLVSSPLRPEPIPYMHEPPAHLPKQYGSYHQLYRLDGKLIAMSIVDILPSCVSSVYFVYDKSWENYSMGKLSALREISLAREIREAGVTSMGYLYLGYYVHSCQKMRYKGEYSPSYLADPITYGWYPLDQCKKVLDKNRYACFSIPEACTNEPAPSEGRETILAIPHWP